MVTHQEEVTLGLSVGQTGSKVPNYDAAVRPRALKEGALFSLSWWEWILCGGGEGRVAGVNRGPGAGCWGSSTLSS